MAFIKNTGNSYLSKRSEFVVRWQRVCVHSLFQGKFCLLVNSGSCQPFHLIGINEKTDDKDVL